ncbi:translation initiation factor [Candidatus Woesearchaeota archaeon]|nr:MAG: translation initiation factor [Candidatus Woesearchaeota archaeon]
MTEIDPLTGLPKELGAWEDITKESQTIEVYIERRKFGKKYTIISGIDAKDINLDDIAKKLKNKLACGGSAKNGMIELQGDHKAKMRKALESLGFAPESIVIK